MGGSAWGKDIQFFCSRHSIPTLVDAEFTVYIDGVTAGGRVGNIEFEGDLFDAQRISQAGQDLELPGGKGLHQCRISE